MVRTSAPPVEGGYHGSMVERAPHLSAGSRSMPTPPHPAPLQTPAAQDDTLTGLRLRGAGRRAQGEGCRVQGAGSRVWSVGCRVQGAGCRV
jgi:hypothetical protein